MNKMVEPEKGSEEKIQKLQLLEQNMQNYLAQKQQFQSQAVEIDSALEELKDQTTAYKIVGNIMVSAKREDLEADLKKKKEMIDLRIKSIEKQEDLIKKKAKTIQEEVLGDMKEADSDK
jgi:prefoldin beta subunit